MVKPLSIMYSGKPRHPWPKGGGPRLLSSYGRQVGIPTSTGSITKNVKLTILTGVPVALKN
jgi:hypothetical protein